MHYVFNENNIKNYKVPLCADIIYTPTKNERNLLFLANLLSLKSKVKSGKHVTRRGNSYSIGGKRIPLKSRKTRKRNKQ